MAIESQENVITCCNGKAYTRSQLLYRAYIWVIIMGLLCLQTGIEGLAMYDMVHRELVGYHVFICTIGGVCMFGTIPVMSPREINKKKTRGHGAFGFLCGILITAGIALLYGNATHAYSYHSVTGFTCVIAIWIQIVLGFMIFQENLTKKDKLWWAKVMHTVLGLAIVISGSICFISGFGTAWFLVISSFLSNPITMYTWYSVCTALLTLLILFLPLYKLTRQALRDYRVSK